MCALHIYQLRISAKFFINVILFGMQMRSTGKRITVHMFKSLLSHERMRWCFYTIWQVFESRLVHSSPISICLFFSFFDSWPTPDNFLGQLKRYCLFFFSFFSYSFFFTFFTSMNLQYLIQFQLYIRSHINILFNYFRISIFMLRVTELDKYKNIIYEKICIHVLKLYTNTVESR